MYIKRKVYTNNLSFKDQRNYTKNPFGSLFKKKSLTDRLTSFLPKKKSFLQYLKDDITGDVKKLINGGKKVIEVGSKGVERVKKAFQGANPFKTKN